MAPLAHFPFQVYCKKLITAFKKAKTNPDPALFLYKNDVRTTLFMAESILRIANKLFEDKEIKEWHAIIKKLEDMLGVIDVYIVLLATYSKLKSVRVQQLEYISNKIDKSVNKLNSILIKHNYFLEDLQQMCDGFKINFNDEHLVLQLHEEIKSELKESCDFFNHFKNGFTDMEDQVHELRRKLRWISIYGESFQGMIVLKEDKENYKWEKEFVTKTETQNPFNKLPVKKNLSQNISFNKKAFYALSYMIDNTGKIKDKSINLYYLDKSIRKTGTESKNDAAIMAAKQLNVKYTQASLLKDAHILFDDYFNKYKIHEMLT